MKRPRRIRIHKTDYNIIKYLYDLSLKFPHLHKDTFHAFALVDDGLSTDLQSTDPGRICSSLLK